MICNNLTEQPITKNNNCKKILSWIYKSLCGNEENKISNIVNVITYILSIIFVIIIKFEGEMILLRIITLDSFLIAAKFLTSYMNNNINDTQVISNTKSVYNYGLIDRYLFYFFLVTLSLIIQYVFWMNSVSVLNYLILLLIYPDILNYVLNHKYYKKIRDIKELTIKLIISKLFSQILEYLSKQILKKEIKLHYTDFISLLDNVQDTCGYLIEVLKNIAAAALLIYVKRYSKKYYYVGLKFVYNMTNNNVKSVQGFDDAKQMLITIITEKKWDEFIKPTVYNAIIVLYIEDQDEQKIIKKIIKYINIKMLGSTAIWTMASVFDSIVICTTLSLAFSLCRYNKTNKFEMLYQAVLMMILLCFTVPYSDHYLLTSLVFQFGYAILFNKITLNVIKFIIKYPVKKVLSVIKNNKDYNAYFVILPTSIVVFSFDINLISTLLLLALVIYDAWMFYNLKKIFVFYILILTCYLSEYNILHVYFNSITLYVLNANINSESFGLVCSYFNCSWIKLYYLCKEFYFKNFSNEQNITNIKINDDYINLQSKTIILKNSSDKNVNQNDNQKNDSEITENIVTSKKLPITSKIDIYGQENLLINSYRFDNLSDINIQISNDTKVINSESLNVINNQPDNIKQINQRLRDKKTFNLDMNSFIDIITEGSGHFDDSYDSDTTSATPTTPSTTTCSPASSDNEENNDIFHET